MANKKFCEVCSRYAGCGFVNRELQKKCDIYQLYDDGYDVGFEDAIQMACEWLKENPPMRFDDIMNYVEQFRKALEGGDE